MDPRLAPLSMLSYPTHTSHGGPDGMPPPPMPNIIPEHPQHQQHQPHVSDADLDKHMVAKGLARLPEPHTDADLDLLWRTLATEYPHRTILGWQAHFATHREEIMQILKIIVDNPSVSNAHYSFAEEELLVNFYASGGPSSASSSPLSWKSFAIDNPTRTHDAWRMYGKRNRARLESRIQARRQEFRDRGITILEDGASSSGSRPRSGSGRGGRGSASFSVTPSLGGGGGDMMMMPGATSTQHGFIGVAGMYDPALAGMPSPTVSMASSSVAANGAGVGPSRRQTRRRQSQSTSIGGGQQMFPGTELDDGEEMLMSDDGSMMGDDEAYVASEPEPDFEPVGDDAGSGSGSSRAKGKGKASKRNSMVSASGGAGGGRARRTSQASTIEAAGGRGVHTPGHRRRQSTSSSTGGTRQQILRFTLDDRVALVQLLAQSGPNPSPADLLAFAGSHPEHTLEDWLRLCDDEHEILQREAELIRPGPGPGPATFPSLPSASSSSALSHPLMHSAAFTGGGVTHDPMAHVQRLQSAVRDEHIDPSIRNVGGGAAQANEASTEDEQFRAQQYQQFVQAATAPIGAHHLGVVDEASAHGSVTPTPEHGADQFGGQGNGNDAEGVEKVQGDEPEGTPEA